jgi:hypothetical protein
VAELADELESWLVGSGVFDSRLTIKARQLESGSPESVVTRYPGGEPDTTPEDCFALRFTMQRPDAEVLDGIQAKLNALVESHGRLFNDRYDRGLATPPNTESDPVMWFGRHLDPTAARAYKLCFWNELPL